MYKVWTRPCPDCQDLTETEADEQTQVFEFDGIQDAERFIDDLVTRRYHEIQVYRDYGLDDANLH